MKSGSWKQLILLMERDPANQLRLVVYHIIYKVLHIPGGCLGFLNHQQFSSIPKLSVNLPDSPYLDCNPLGHQVSKPTFSKRQRTTLGTRPPVNRSKGTSTSRFSRCTTPYLLKNEGLPYIATLHRHILHMVKNQVERFWDPNPA